MAFRNGLTQVLATYVLARLFAYLRPGLQLALELCKHQVVSLRGSLKGNASLKSKSSATEKEKPKNLQAQVSPT
ncbi:uncharacterized protein ACLA_028460 [Aspergillus clavatus NRRL 1]|uniref:Uncharacterized protein n=1 Tax=Aspergillus clavatus (strain ATCC 1007 / CBS 513.65 / DSM 816 / NCTC 3887 / NRRL 1 / QM 1276 / 107) TaxID=344612 RepID=A1CR50_ASPCL|nr:uncharacterized protein ACLA_028460 [Aspergillus clavatus NRRL 1]EAW08121.1 hypothetical protein ACLA_028460 [Aspergillus clavatus NRRL 1]